MLTRWNINSPTTISSIELSSFRPQLRRAPPVSGARCSNQLLEHLEHLEETKDLFDNVAKSHSEAK
jgi:hypothetical protein